MDNPTWEDSEPIQNLGDSAPTWDQSEPVPQQSPLESAGRGALRNIPMAQQAYAAAAPAMSKVAQIAQKYPGLESLVGGLPIGQMGPAKSNYSDELQHLTDAAEQGKMQNPGAYGTGAVIGTLAPLAIPVAGEALGAAGPALSAAEIAGGAGISGGALAGAAQNISDTNLVKNPVKALGQATVGAGIGGATAGILGKVFPNASETLENASTKSAVKSGMFNRNYLGHMDEEEVGELGNFMKEHGVVDRNTPAAIEQAKEIKNAYGQKIGEMGADAQSLSDPDKFVKGLADKADNLTKRVDPEFIKQGNTYNYAAQEIKKMGDSPTFAQLQELKSIYGDRAFNADHTIADKAASDVYFTLKDMMGDIVKGAPDEYAKALKGYSYSTELLKGLAKKVGTERAGSQGIGAGSISRVIRQLPAPVRYTAGATAAALGHPYIAAASLLPEIMNPALHSQILSGAAKAAGNKGLSRAAQLELANALTSKFGQGK